MILLNFLKKLNKIIAKKTVVYPVEASELDRTIMDFCKPFSMTSSERIWATISATKYIIKNGICGDFVECGVWRGGSSMAMMMTLKNLGATDRQLYLFDTFSGMTEPSKKDVDNSGSLAKTLLNRTNKGNGNNIWCIASIEDVKQNFSKLSYPEEKLRLIKGDVAASLKEEANIPNKIALLRLDTDWYESTKIEMEVLFPRLVKGGVCIIDDYGHWQGARHAVDEYLKIHHIFPLLHVTDYTGRAFIKI